MPKKPVTPKGLKTRNEILEATAESIADVGVENTSITEIAGRIGKSRGLIARYFPKKKEIFAEVIRYIAGRFYEFHQQALKSRAMEELKGEPALVLDLRTNLRFFLQNAAYFRCFLLFYYYASFDRKYRAMNSAFTGNALTRLTENLREFLGDRAAKITHLETLSTMLHHELTASIQQWYIMEGSSPRERFEQEVVDRCLLLVQSHAPAE